MKKFNNSQGDEGVIYFSIVILVICIILLLWGIISGQIPLFNILSALGFLGLFMGVVLLSTWISWSKNKRRKKLLDKEMEHLVKDLKREGQSKQ